MKLSFHGGCYEIGKSCIEVATEKTRILLDSGTKFTEECAEYPRVERPDEVDAVALSHAHLDHCGALPFFRHQGLQCQIICSRMTKQLARILLKDSYKIETIERAKPLYTEDDVHDVLDFMQPASFCQQRRVNEMNITLFDSGHIPGSSSVLIEAEGKRLLYTGDLNTEESNLMHPADTDYPPIDILICESTYGDRDHPPRKQEELSFLSDVKAALEKGPVLIAVLAVARAQEVILMLSKKKFTAPMYLDGMAKKVNAQLIAQPDAVKDVRWLKHALAKVHVVRGQNMRQNIAKTKSIFVSSSGMLDGGPVLAYLNALWHRKDAAIMLTSFQGHGTNGRLLLDESAIYLDGTRRHVNCSVRKYDFSSHIGMTPLHDYIRKIKPKHLILNHGDPQALETLGAWAKKEGFRVSIPKVGDELIL